MYYENETICAISTAKGIGAIAIIRITGEKSFEIAEKILLQKDFFSKLEEKKILFCEIIDINNNILDDVLIVKFKTPASFTGENMVEIYCHGSEYIQQKILELLIKNGASLAKAGEFSQRAFLNGKIDLSQAEAISDLISSQTAAAHKQAINQMKGNFKKELQTIRENLLNFVSLLELELDFSEEDVEFADRTNLLHYAKQISTKIKKLSNSFKVGNVIKNGISVTIAGKTNVGKSTLLNILLNEEKAIVSDVHGTTRDSIEDSIVIDGICFRFVDTAGIRKTNDIIENLGIERTYNKIKNSEIILLLIDINEEIQNIENFVLEQSQIIDTENKTLYYVFNKIDLANIEKQKTIRKLEFLKDNNLIFISAKDNKIENLLEEIIKIAKDIQNNDSDIIITNVRHYESLIKSNKSMERVISGLENNISSDFLSQDIREIMHYLGEITGEFSNDEILGNIFKNFCIGK